MLDYHLMVTLREGRGDYAFLLYCLVLVILQILNCKLFALGWHSYMAYPLNYPIIIDPHMNWRWHKYKYGKFG